MKHTHAPECPICRYRREELAGKMVRAFNAHDDMLAALEEVRGYVETPGDFSENDVKYLLEDLDAAIAKAKGE